MDLVGFLQGDALRFGISLATLGPWPIVASGFVLLVVVVLKSR